MLKMLGAKVTRATMNPGFVHPWYEVYKIMFLFVWFETAVVGAVKCLRGDDL